jgi:formate dehydrogenase major subunit
MTNHWIDLKNADVILVMGGNPAENHPVSMKWIMKAKKERGAKLIVVDPKFSRTASKADLYIPIRPGTDIAFLGGLIKYIIDNELYFKEYVVNYTDASFLVDPEFKLPEDLDGVFSGYDPVKRKYDKSTWKYQLDENGIPKKDPTLQDPHCVLQLLKRHFSRYTIDIVSQITGAPKDKILEAYKIIASTGKPNKVATECYAMGWTQHTVGVQNIRAMAIIQLLLGNIGMAGGGVNALRGESNVQGSTDMCLLFHILPGYLPMIRASHVDLKTYIEKTTPTTKEPKSLNWWKHRPKYIVSLLKAFYGDYATKENDFCFNYLPKLDDGKTYSWYDMFDAMYKGKIKGFFAWGQNPACSSANANKARQALAKLDWLVCVNLWDSETSSFWKGPGMDPKKIKTEVFLLPCAASVEKEGSITNSGRWLQWRYKAVNPPGECKPDSEIVNELFLRIKRLYEKEGGVFPEPILHLNWNYGEKEVDTKIVAKEVNGYFTKDVIIKGKRFKKGQQVPNFVYLLDDGSTACGNWLYSGCYTEEGNMMARRGKEDPTGLGLYSKWAWCWPVNRRILYNRASVDPYGKPWDPERPVIKWDNTNKKWIGDVPDGPQPPLALGGVLPFIMKPTGVGTIFGRGRVDGPFPTYYEPVESPFENPLYKKVRFNPVAKIFKDTPADKILTKFDPDYPYIGTTYRVTEHWQTGLMTRHMDWLLELEPQIFAEIDKELAKEKGIKSGDKVIISTPRGRIWAIAIVTDRIKPLNIMGRKCHVVGIPWHYGWRWPEDGSGGDSANLLTPPAHDPNTMIQESKCFLVNIEKA